MTDRSDDPLGVIALLAALFFLWRYRAGIQVNAVAFLPVGLLLALQAFLPLAPMLRGVCFVAALALALDLPRRSPGIAALLGLSLPLVASLQYFAGYPLRLVTAEISRIVPLMTGCAVERTGTMLTWQGHLVGVDPACSGVKMLWSALFLAAAVSARNRLNGRATLSLLAAAGALILVANGLRAGILFFPEAGLVHWPAWTHEGAGLVLYAVAAGGLVRLSDCFQSQPITPVPASAKGSEVGWRVSPKFMACGVALVALSASAFTLRPVPPSPGSARDWPAEFEGETLIPVPLSAREERFAAVFPGEIRIFTTSSGRTIILRHVTRVSRMLHSSADCLRGAGADVIPAPAHRDSAGRMWSACKVSGLPGISRMREIIHGNDDQTFSDPSAWFWAALTGSSKGPWLAVTLIE